MAIKAKVETVYGEYRECYIRLNSVEANNHGFPCIAVFRGYVSEQAYRENKAPVWEQMVEFRPDVSKVLWEQAYTFLKQGDPAAPEEQELQRVLDEHQNRSDLAKRAKEEPPPPPDTAVLENRLALARKLRDSLRNAKDV